MRHFPWIIGLFCLGMFVGCPAQQAQDTTTTGPEQEEVAPAPKEKAGESPDVTTGEVKQQVGEAAEAIGELAKQKSADALNAARAGYDDAKKKVAELKSNMGELQGTAREEYQKTLDDLDRQLSEANKKLQQLADSSGEAWTAAKDDLQNAMSDLEKAYEKAAAAFKEREAKGEKVEQKAAKPDES